MWRSNIRNIFSYRNGLNSLKRIQALVHHGNSCDLREHSSRPMQRQVHLSMLKEIGCRLAEFFKADIKHWFYILLIDK